MNKGLEVIEAHELFGVDFDQIEVVVHPQSIDPRRWSSSPTAPRSPSSRCPTCACRSGSPSVRPARLDEAFGAIDWTTLGTLTFEPPDLDAFPCLRPGLRGRAGRRRRAGAR